MGTPARRGARAPKVKEISLHMSVAAFLRHALPDHLVFFHVPNGEARDARTGGKLKAMGVLAGVPDFAVHLPRGQIAYIELKAGAGALSDPQIDFRSKVTALGCGYVTARSLEDVERILTIWLGKFGLTPRATLGARRAA